MSTTSDNANDLAQQRFYFLGAELLLLLEVVRHDDGGRVAVAETTLNSEGPRYPTTSADLYMLLN